MTHRNLLEVIHHKLRSLSESKTPLRYGSSCHLPFLNKGLRVDQYTRPGNLQCLISHTLRFSWRFRVHCGGGEKVASDHKSMKIFFKLETLNRRMI